MQCLEKNPSDCRRRKNASVKIAVNPTVRQMATNYLQQKMHSKNVPIDFSNLGFFVSNFHQNTENKKWAVTTFKRRSV